MSKYATTLNLRMPMVRSQGTRKVRASTRRWFLVPLLGIIVFGLLYVFVVNHTASQGYQMRDLEQQISTLERETKVLKLNVAELQSMESIGSRIVGMEFVPVAEVQYLRAGAPAVVLK
jgi:hypothetical protein